MAVYYKYLFSKRDEISDSEGIVYSYLIFKALNNPDFYDRETGKLSGNAIKAFLNSSFMYGHFESLELDLNSINKSRISQETGLSRGSVYNIINRLKEKEILSDRYISCPIELIDEGYIELPSDTRLTGQQLVFYAFLKDRARGHNNTVDTWVYRLAELFCTSEDNINFLITTLKKAGYIERLENRKLKIK